MTSVSLRFPEFGGSNYVDLGSTGGLSGNVTLYTNPHTALNVVVTDMSLGNTSGSSGVAAGIFRNNTALVMSGNVGAGQYDTFVWSGHCVLRPGDQLLLNTIGASTWTWHGAGYIVPRFDQHGYFG